MEESCRRPTRRWEGNIKMDLEEIISDAMDGFIGPRLGTNGISL